MVKLYFKMFALKVKEQLEYRVSFILDLLSQLVTFFTFYFAVIILFERFSNIAGYTKYEILLTFGIIFFGYAFNEVFIRGIDRFEDLIISGDLDRLLLRPQNVLLQACANQIDFVKIVRFIEAFIIILIAALNINIEWTAFKISILILMCIASAVLFFGLFVLMASYCFLTVQGLEIKNLVLDGGKYLAEYPISIYPKKVMRFLTFVIPYGVINYYPLLYILGRSDNILFAFSPLIVFIFIIPCIGAFYLGLRKYSSTGS